MQSHLWLERSCSCAASGAAMEPKADIAIEGSLEASSVPNLIGKPSCEVVVPVDSVNKLLEPDRMSETSCATQQKPQKELVPKHIERKRSAAALKKARQQVRESAEEEENEQREEKQRRGSLASIVPMDEPTHIVPASIRQSAARRASRASISKEAAPWQATEEEEQKSAPRRSGKTGGAMPGQPQVLPTTMVDGVDSEKDLQRKKLPWIILAVIVVTWQFVAFVYFPAQAEACAFGRQLEKTVHGELYENHRYGPGGVLRQIVFPWVSAFMFGIHWDHRGRIKPRGRAWTQHTWTKVYAYLLVSYSVCMYMRIGMIGICPFSTTDDPNYNQRRDLYSIALAWNRFAYMASLVILLKLMCLKICTLAGDEEFYKVNGYFQYFCMSCVVQQAARLTHLPSEVQTFTGIFFLFFSFIDLALFCAISFRAIQALDRARRITMTEMRIMMEDLDGDLRSTAIEQGSAEHTVWQEEIRLVEEAADWAKTLMRMTAGSAMSSIFFLSARTINNFTNSHYPYFQALAACAVVIDLTLNALCTALLSGLLGPREEAEAREQKMQTVGDKVMTNKERAVCDKLAAALKMSAQGRSNEAAVLASMMGNKDAEEIFESSVKRFRAVDWDVLQDNIEIFRGGTLDGQKASADLLELSFLCEIGECDAFLSHSWHDDSELKIEKLTKWCEDFRSENDYAPVLWVDKLCINQSDIVSDLECLPVFLAGCGNLLVLSGLTYTTRLWCIVELFVYVNMQSEGANQLAGLTVIPLADEQAEEKVWDTWARFQADACNCFKQADKDHIMEIIRKFTGGIEGFNKSIVQLVADVRAGKATYNDGQNRVKSFKKMTRQFNSDRQTSGRTTG